MGQSLEQLMTVAREAKDTAHAAASALWKRSAAGQEMARLREDGHLPGEPCELAFAFSFGEGEGDAAMRALTSAGFTVADRSNAARGFLTVTTPATLGSYTIARTAARLRRLGQRHGGHAEVIGLVGEAPRTIELTGPRRAVGSRARSVA
jgi:hypothetical protein